MLLLALNLRQYRGGIVPSGLRKAHAPGPRAPVHCVGEELDGLETLLVIFVVFPSGDEDEY